MKVLDLDHNSTNWSLLGATKNLRKNVSSLHRKCYELIKELYPTVLFLQEIPIPLRRTETLYLDFYIPMLKKAIEVHGEQHYKFVSHYHNNAMGFIKQKKRDSEKREWCELNGIQYIELPFNENNDIWKQKILKN
jgi:hypothetical protein